MSRDEATPEPASLTPIDLRCSSSIASSWLDLSSFDNSDFDPGRGPVVRTLWYFCSLLVFEGGWFPLSSLKIRLLRLFGAQIGRGVVLKPNVRIKYPWRLTIGDHCWIGQEVWIDNLVEVEIGAHVCVSQLVYFCTGSHDHRKRSFDLLTRPIRIGDGAWLGARSMLLQGVVVGANALVAGGSIVTKNVDQGAIVAGNPAVPVSRRTPPPV